MKKYIKAIVILVIAIIVLFKFVKIQDIILKNIYPIKYSDYVEKYSEKYGVDKFLVYAIIKGESNFNPNSESSVGAYGLMQIMEETAKETAKNVEYNFENKNCLYEPEINIMLGTKYFSELLKRYNNNIHLSLIAYNAGIGNVSNWIKDGTIREDGQDIENVPFKETNNYVRKIIRDYDIYKELYNL